MSSQKRTARWKIGGWSRISRKNLSNICKPVFWENDNILFNTMKKQRILVLINSSCNGNVLWWRLMESGKIPGRVNHSSSGKCVSQNEMKCFISAAPFMFADDEHFWFIDDRTWHRWGYISISNGWIQWSPHTTTSFFYLLMLDESMVGSRPKTSQ